MPIIRQLIEGASGSGARSKIPRLHGRSTSAGVDVDPERSLRVSSVYACVRLISEAIAQLPVHIYRRTSDARLPVEDHPLLELLTVRPNSDIDAGEFYRAIVGWMLLRGNGLTYRQIGGDGRTQGLWPIAPTSVTVERTSRGRLAYGITLSQAEYVPGFMPGIKRTVSQDRVLHFRAFGFGVWGLSPVALARTKIGTAFAAEEYGAGFFGRGGVPGGVLQTDQQLTDEEWERLNEWWKNEHQGFENSHMPAVLEGGLEWKGVTLPPAEAQFLDTQRYTAATIAGHIFFVPPHLIGDVERSTSWGTGIAEQGIAFVRYSLMPWIVRLERVLNQLLGDPSLYVKFNTAALERGSLKDRYDAYQVGRQWGWLSSNDVLRKEDEPPIGPEGDVYMHPLNMVPAGSLDAPRSAPAGQAARGRARSQLKDRHVDAHERAMVGFFEQQADEVLADFRGGRRDFDRDESDRKLAGLLAGLGLATATDSAQEVTEQFNVDLDDGGFASWMRTMGENVATNINELTLTSVAAAESSDDAAEVFRHAATVRAGQIAATRTAEAFGFGRQEGAKQAGAGRKTWRTTSGNPRSSHAALDGETVKVGDTFSNGARWPGDTANLDADEAAGCRCEMEIHP